MNEKDRENTVKRYSERFAKHGYSEEALGWSRNKNEVRFEALISEWKSELQGASIADFGCGFGDLFGYVKNNLGITNIDYTGIDINPDLIAEGKARYPEAKFWVGDINETLPNTKFDFIFSSGVFNHKLEFVDEYDFIKDCIKQLDTMSTKGFAVNFLSDKVEYKLEHTFHSNPGKILDIFYQYSNHIVLKNDYMPFEFTVFLRKDKAIDSQKIIYI